MAKSKKVLTDEHYDRLQKLQKAASETRDYLQQCRSCHLDVDREHAANEEQLKIAEAIKRTFFPSKH